MILKSTPTNKLQMLAHYAIDGLATHIAILDQMGVIVATNRAWNEFATSNALSNALVSQASIGVGANYLTVCDRAAGRCSDARSFAEGIRAVIAGEKPLFELEYPCHSPTEERWFVGRVTRFTTSGALYVIVAHENITITRQAENQVREQENTLRSFYDSAPMMMGVIELVADNLLHVSYNLAAAKFFGARSEPLSAPNLSEQKHNTLDVAPEHLATWISRCQDSARTGLPVRFVYPHVVASDARWFAVTICFIAQMPRGRPRYSYMIEDITERVLAEQETRLFSTVINESQSGIIITDSRECIIYANPAFERLSGYTLEELRGRRPGSVLQGEGTDKRTKRMIRETLLAKKPISMELINYHKNGQPYWIEMNIAPVFDASGELTHFVAIANDITRRKSAEESLRQSQTRLEEAQHIARVGSWEYDIATRKITWSKELFHLRGRDPALGEPTYEESMALYPHEDATRLHRLVTRAIQKGIGYEVDLQGIMADGSTRWYHAIASTVKDEGGNVIRLVGTLLDITQRKQSEQELADLHRSLQQAREAETAISARVQSMLLAPTVPQDLPGVRIASLSLPSQQVDGDFSDFVVHSDTLFDLVIGDVMGKGLTAALLGAATKARILRSFIYLLDNAPDAGMPSPEALVSRVHTKLTPQLIQLETFITATFVRFDLANQRAILVDCGHTHTIHYQATTDEYGFIQGDGLPLGVLEQESYRQINISICPGDLFVFYSDGITEARNREGEMYGANRLIDLLRSHRCEAPQQQIEALQRSLQEYTHATSFADDVTCIVVAIHE